MSIKTLLSDKANQKCLATVALLILLVSGFFMLKAEKAQADELPVDSGQQEFTLSIEEDSTASNKVCDVYIPNWSSWDFEVLTAKAAQYGCVVKQYFIGEEDHPS